MENTILSGIHQAVGDTPIVHLSKLTENLAGYVTRELARKEGIFIFA
ncbi:hypothetical protein GPJ61_03925 [Brevibacillus formosus]|nr:hypothetical protein [Brevibacillus formosus]MBW5467025.1 hypothetical protein [Brevibacillus formosus]